jgi:hypothetical protein
MSNSVLKKIAAAADSFPDSNRAFVDHPYLGPREANKWENVTGFIHAFTPKEQGSISKALKKKK